MTPPTILVIRRDDQFSADLRNAGLSVLNLDLIETVPLADLRECDERIGRINDYDGLFFTSPVAAEIFLDRLRASGAKFGGQAYVLGHRARAVVEGSGMKMRFTDADTAAEMIRSFGETEFEDKSFLFVRGDKSLRAIPEELEGKASVDEIVVYETRDIRPDEKAIDSTRNALMDGAIDWTCFFSPSGVRRFRDLFPTVSGDVKMAAIGETTAEEMRRCNLNVDFISPRSRAQEFAAGLIDKINNSE